MRLTRPARKGIFSFALALGGTVLYAAAPSWGATAAEKDKGKEEEKPYHIEADATEAYMSAGGRVLHGIGHVVIVHGDTKITCDEAYSYEGQDLATLLGNVRVDDAVQKYTLTSDYGEYRRKEKVAVATKGPKLVIRRERETEITGEIMRMWTDKEYGEAAGNVRIISGDVVGDGQLLKYFGKEDKVQLTGSPVVSQNDNRLAADEITLFLKDEGVDHAFATGNVRLIYFSRSEDSEEESKKAARESETETSSPNAASPENANGSPLTEKENAASAESATARQREDGVEKETPTGRIEASGDKMEAFFVEDALERVDITGNAEGHYWPFDEIGRETGEQVDAAGDVIRVTLAGGEVKRITVDGNAEGIYRPARAEGRAGVTYTAGDRITVFVSAREVRRITVYGNARGSYYAEETPATNEGKVKSG